MTRNVAYAAWMVMKAVAPKLQANKAMLPVKRRVRTRKRRAMPIQNRLAQRKMVAKVKSVERVKVVKRRSGMAEKKTWVRRKA